jgi:hypothetical protein
MIFIGHLQIVNCASISRHEQPLGPVTDKSCNQLTLRGAHSMVNCLRDASGQLMGVGDAG